MASFCRSVTVVGTRTISRSSKSSISRSLFSKFISSSRRSVMNFSRFSVPLGDFASLMPLHSAIASARLKSILSADSTCRSLLCQGLAIPL